MNEEEKNNYIKPIGETLQDKINYYQNKVFELNKLLEKKNAVIDKMAEQLEKCKNEIDCLTEGDEDCFIPEEFSNIDDCVKYKTCKHCIKDYFTNLVEKENK